MNDAEPSNSDDAAKTVLAKSLSLINGAQKGAARSSAASACVDLHAGEIDFHTRLLRVVIEVAERGDRDQKHANKSRFPVHSSSPCPTGCRLLLSLRLALLKTFFCPALAGFSSRQGLAGSFGTAERLRRANLPCAGRARPISELDGALTFVRWLQGGHTPTALGDDPAVTTVPLSMQALGGCSGPKQKLRPITVKKTVTAASTQ